MTRKIKIISYFQTKEFLKRICEPKTNGKVEHEVKTKLEVKELPGETEIYSWENREKNQEKIILKLNYGKKSLLPI